jgi:hypothetical protein
MDARDLFLEQHAAVQSAAVGGNKMSTAERTFGSLTDEQMRVRPREDLNSLAWILWHIARSEDIFVNRVLYGITRRDFGIGMTSPEVTELTKQIEIGALREYRDGVGRRTRELVSGFKAEDWEGQVTPERIATAAAEGGFGTRAEAMKVFTGRPRRAVLSGIALFHSSGHMGEANTVRTAGGFGTGV